MSEIIAVQYKPEILLALSEDDSHIVVTEKETVLVQCKNEDRAVTWYAISFAIDDAPNVMNAIKILYERVRGVPGHYLTHTPACDEPRAEEKNPGEGLSLRQIRVLELLNTLPDDEVDEFIEKREERKKFYIKRVSEVINKVTQESEREILH